MTEDHLSELKFRVLELRIQREEMMRQRLLLHEYVKNSKSLRISNQFFIDAVRAVVEKKSIVASWGSHAQG